MTTTKIIENSEEQETSFDDAFRHMLVNFSFDDAFRHMLVNFATYKLHCTVSGQFSRSSFQLYSVLM